MFKMKAPPFPPLVPPPCQPVADLALLSIITLGRTGGGGTGSMLMRNQSGLVNCVLKPRALQSSSLMADMI